MPAYLECVEHRTAWLFGLSLLPIRVANRCRSQTSFRLRDGVRCPHRSGTDAGVCLLTDSMILVGLGMTISFLSRHCERVHDQEGI